MRGSAAKFPRCRTCNETNPWGENPGDNGAARNTPAPSPSSSTGHDPTEDRIFAPIYALDSRAFKKTYFRAMRYVSLNMVVALVVLTVHASVDHAGPLHFHSNDTASPTNDHPHFHGVEAEHEDHEHAPSEHESDGHRHELQVATVGTHMSQKLLAPVWDCVRAAMTSDLPPAKERSRERRRDPTKRPPIFLLSRSLLV